MSGTGAAPWRALSLLGYFGLWVLLPQWYGWLLPPQTLPLYAILLFFLTPLTLLLPGLLAGHPRSYAWSGFAALLYFTHGVGEAYASPADRPYAWLEIACSLCWFIGAIGYVRRRRDSTAP